MKTKSGNKQLHFILMLSLFLLITAVTIGYADSSGEKWGFQAIEHHNDGTWLVVGGMTTVYDNGTGTTAYNYNSDGTIGSGTENFTSSKTLNPDGSFTMTNTFSDRIQVVRCVASDDKRMLICDGTADTGKQTMLINVNMDETKTYTNADLNGEYYGIGYENNANYVAPPYGNGNNMAISSIGTFYGDGTYTYSGKANSDGTIWDDDGGNKKRTYSVNPDGSFTIGSGGVVGYLSEGEKLGIVSSPGITDKWISYFSMKKGDKVYSTADIAGKWAIAGFGDDYGNSFNAEFGSMTCDVSGNCLIPLKNQRDGSITYETLSATFSVASDGSFGDSINPDIPSYAGVLGNNGNTIIFNVSFDSSKSYHREIFIGVRCSECSDLQGLFPDLVVKSVGNIPAQKKRGGKFNIKDIVMNRGNTLVPSTTITRYYLSRNRSLDKDDILLDGTRTVPELEIGATSGGKEPAKLTIPIETSHGSYYVIVCADDMHNVEELNEDNNCRRSQRKIRVK